MSDSGTTLCVDALALGSSDARDDDEVAGLAGAGVRGARVATGGVVPTGAGTALVGTLVGAVVSAVVGGGVTVAVAVGVTAGVVGVAVGVAVGAGVVVGGVVGVAVGVVVGVAVGGGVVGGAVVGGAVVGGAVVAAGALVDVVLVLPPAPVLVPAPLTAAASPVPEPELAEPELPGVDPADTPAVAVAATAVPGPSSTAAATSAPTPAARTRFVDAVVGRSVSCRTSTVPLLSSHRALSGAGSWLIVRCRRAPRKVKPARRDADVTSTTSSRGDS
ncbi:hypothetical protein [Quadrisphaera granulorum]|uniref:hypothetical protein n=1 Tax=Quadrisphaera granulorum TaxID=317664 RepID=UPI000D6B2A5C|nr:hypothetical protein [Quadrisphaera granulorum]